MADEHNHAYGSEDQIVVWLNTIGPYDNQQETYEYQKLPLCVGTHKIEHHHESLGEALQGFQLTPLGVNMRFLVNEQDVPICERSLSPDDRAQLDVAIQQRYWYSMYLDNLPVWAFLGVEAPIVKNTTTTTDATPTPKAALAPAAADDDDGYALVTPTRPEPEIMQTYLYTHRNFDIAFNGDRIIEVNVTAAHPVALRPHDPTSALGAEPQRVQFTYSVTWRKTDQPFKTRFSKYLDSEFFEHRVHWFSICNSFMLVLFLLALVSAILFRTLRRDFARYDREESLLDFDRDLGDDYGWKQVHGDVFRPPPRLLLLSACYGTGFQLLCLAFFTVLYIIAGELYMERSSILSAAIFIYALTSVVGGHASAGFYTKYGGQNWIKLVFVTAGLWPSMVGAVCLSINAVAILQTSSRAIPFGTMVVLVVIWLMLVLPLTLIGSIVGRNGAGHASFPCRVHPIPRPVPRPPERGTLTRMPFVTIAAGLLPFGSIFIEMYFIFTSFWAYKIYYVYGFMLFVLGILCIVTACVAVVAVYVLLNAEEHRWHWRAFIAAGGGTALYVYAYSIFYYTARTRMFGTFQTLWYFGYMGLACIGLLLMLGAIALRSAEVFVQKIYSNVKID